MRKFPARAKDPCWHEVLLMREFPARAKDFRWHEELQYSLQGGEATLEDAVASQPAVRATG